MVYTQDHGTGGFLDDVELVIQLLMDQGNMSLKFVCKRGINMFHETLNVFGNNGSLNTSLLHLFTRINHRICTVPSLLNRYSSSLMAAFKQPVKDMFKNNIDSTTVKDMVSSQGYAHESYEVETEDGYINILDRVVN